MRKRWLLFLIVLAIAFLALSVPPASEPMAKSNPSSNVTVYFVNVGQGDATFIDTANQDVLIDGGKRSAGSGLVSFLNSTDHGNIAIVIATHPDADHIGGLVNVLEQLNVGQVWDGGFNKSTDVYGDYRSLAETRNFTIVGRGRQATLAAGVMLEVLNPVQPLEFKEANDNSIVARLKVGEISFLFTGDCEIDCEKSILRAASPKATVLKVSHHGSKSATSQQFLAAVDPRYAIISVGQNSYGHPAPEVLSRLTGLSIFRTDRNGTIAITTDGKGVQILTER